MGASGKRKVNYLLFLEILFMLPLCSKCLVRVSYFIGLETASDHYFILKNNSTKPQFDVIVSKKHRMVSALSTVSHNGHIHWLEFHPDLEGPQRHAVKWDAGSC